MFEFWYSKVINYNFYSKEQDWWEKKLIHKMLTTIGIWKLSLSGAQKVTIQYHAAFETHFMEIHTNSTELSKLT